MEYSLRMFIDFGCSESPPSTEESPQTRKRKYNTRLASRGEDKTPSKETPGPQTAPTTHKGATSPKKSRKSNQSFQTSGLRKFLLVLLSSWLFPIGIIVNTVMIYRRPSTGWSASIGSWGLCFSFWGNGFLCLWSPWPSTSGSQWTPLRAGKDLFEQRHFSLDRGSPRLWR